MVTPPVARSASMVLASLDQHVLPVSAPLPGIDQDPRAWFELTMTELEIDPETCVPDWYAGDIMNWDLAVAALFPYPSRPH